MLRKAEAPPHVDEAFLSRALEGIGDGSGDGADADSAPEESERRAFWDLMAAEAATTRDFREALKRVAASQYLLSALREEPTEVFARALAATATR